MNIYLLFGLFHHYFFFGVEFFQSENSHFFWDLGYLHLDIGKSCLGS